MIPRAVVQKIIHLSAAGLKQNHIAEHLGISRFTVATVLKGEHTHQQKEDSDPKIVSPYRCRCGYLVTYKPCQVCKSKME